MNYMRMTPAEGRLNYMEGLKTMKRVTRRGGVVAITTTVASILALVATAGAASRAISVRGGSGVVSTYGVAKHLFGTTQPKGVRSFAGKPSAVEYLNKYGQSTSRKHAVWETLSYTYAGGTYVAYSFHRSQHKWLFAQFDTTRNQFRTARGTRVGMTYAQAKQREHVPYMEGCIDSGFWHFRDGTRYAIIVGVKPGHRVHALHAYGRWKLPC